MTVIKCYLDRGKSMTISKDGKKSTEKSMWPVVREIDDPIKYIPEKLKQLIGVLDNVQEIIYSRHEILITDGNVDVIRNLDSGTIEIYSDEKGIDDIAIKYFGLPPHNYFKIEIGDNFVRVDGKGVLVEGRDFDDVFEKLKRLLPVYYKFENVLDDEILYSDKILFWRNEFSSPDELECFIREKTEKYPGLKFRSNTLELRLKNGKLITSDFEALDNIIGLVKKLDALGIHYDAWFLNNTLHVTVYPNAIYFYEDKIIISIVTPEDVEIVRKVASVIPQYSWALEYLDE